MKTLYSLVLSSEIVDEIDKIAYERGVNRSKLVNQILAEYVRVMTPEMQVNNMFSEIEGLLSSYFDSFTNLGRAVEMKRALDVKYKPKITYELQLSDVRGVKIGELKMQWRTQHEGVINCITHFVNMWAEAERNVLPKELMKYIEHNLEDGRFTRNFVVLGKIDDSSICEGISGYVKNFDRLLNASLSGKMKSLREIEEEYLKYIDNGGYVI